MGSTLMLLQRYEQHGEAFLSRTVTGDETWVFHYTPESKAESITWKHPHSPVKNKFKTVQSTGKVMAAVSGMFTEFFWLISHLPVQQ
jgi:hypothetical protein